ncbi:MAG: group 1 truncated hemoglobin [Gammaproteobacteria bacterium]|nr:group 1 truncated hemoglobin [Gammaproteobacteria bacterium]
MSLYEKYGGFGQINKVVMAFYDSLLDSDELGPYFDDVEMPKLIDHQTKFMADLLGGPASFSDDHLQKAHVKLNVTHEHFDELKVILHKTLLDHKVEIEDANLVLEAVEARRSFIVRDT